MALNQERVTEVTTFIHDHPNEFRSEMVQSEEFRGFLIFMDQYLKQRLEKNEKFKEIFLGFTNHPDKEDFELERLNSALAEISLDALELLAIIKREVIPGMDGEIELELEKVNPNSDRSIDWWRDYYRHSKSVWQPLDLWLKTNFDTNSEKVKEKFGVPKNEGWPSDLLNRARNLESDERNKASEATSELLNLGVFRLKVTGASIGGASDYLITRFGYKFLTYLEI